MSGVVTVLGRTLNKVSPHPAHMGIVPVLSDATRARPDVVRELVDTRSNFCSTVMKTAGRTAGWWPVDVEIYHLPHIRLSLGSAFISWSVYSTPFRCRFIGSLVLISMNSVPRHITSINRTAS